LRSQAPMSMPATKKCIRHTQLFPVVAHLQRISGT
jgi:hypothetical protein